MYTQIRPLDCIFFKGTDFFSRGIATAEEAIVGKGEWTHVGIVINKRFMPSLHVADNNKLYLWESNISSRNKFLNADPTLDAESKKPILGIQVRDLESVLKYSLTHGVKVGWGRLKNNPLVRRENEWEVRYKRRLNSIRKVLDKLHIENYHRPYSKNICRLFAALLPCCSGCRNEGCLGEDWRFCSQFVAIVYKSIGVLGKDVDPELVLPQDLATEELSHEGLPDILDPVITIDESWIKS